MRLKTDVITPVLNSATTCLKEAEDIHREAQFEELCLQSWRRKAQTIPAPTMNIAPTILPSPTLTLAAGKNQPSNPGQHQFTTPKAKKDDGDGSLIHMSRPILASEVTALYDGDCVGVKANTARTYAMRYGTSVAVALAPQGVMVNK